MKIVDLRSDTLSRPTPEMRQAIFQAEVGDDVFGEDPTVNALEQKTAEIFGKEAALFVTSGTMGNQLAIKCHTRPGDELICENDCHIFNYEAGAPALLSGVQIRPLRGERGVITAAQISEILLAPDDHHARQTLVAVENTHNRAGGAIFPLSELQKIAELVHSRGMKFHLDGARLWNASIATGIKERSYAAHFDSVSVCLSKGLGAPVGSVLVGSGEFVTMARRYRKICGGGMRQAGILAAAGLYAIDHHRERLRDDHRRAKRLAMALQQYPGIAVDVEKVQTNIVIANVKASGREAKSIVAELEHQGVKTLPMTKYEIRLVTYLDITDADIDRTLEVFDQVLLAKEKD